MSVRLPQGVSVRTQLVAVGFRRCMDVLVFVCVLMGIGRTALPSHVELGRADATTDDGLRPDGVPCDREAAERAADVLERDARVDESTQDHVAGGTGETVEVEDRQDLQSYSSRSLARGH